MIPVCDMWTGCAETAEWINFLFVVETAEDPRNIVLDGGPIPHSEGVGGINAAFATVLWSCFSSYVIIICCSL